MPSYLMESRDNGQVLVWLDYTDPPPRATALRVINNSNGTCHGYVERSNGVRISGDFPAHTTTTLPINPAQFTITIVNGEPDVVPNYGFNCDVG